MPFGFSLLRKNSEDLEVFRDITDDVIESDFVPYACHYDGETVLTKNGELLQTLKITGFHYEHIGSERVDLRETIRRAISASIKDNSYALWFNTVRRKMSFALPGQYDNSFSDALHRAWLDRNQWEQQFVNELYITIVKEGQSSAITDPRDFMRGLLPARDNAHREAYLEQACAELNTVVNNMLGVLEQFGARRLSLNERDGVVYSEPLEFFNKVSNLVDDPMELPDMDLSEYLTTHDVTFGYNTMEVRSRKDGRRRFASMLTVKEYKELALHAIDRFLQLPIEFIVTQCHDFINRDKALATYRQQKNFIITSKDHELARLSGLDDILDSDKGSPTDYGEHQLSVFILADSVKELERYVAKAVKALSSMGIIAIREDLKFEECYWAQLPANFEFIRRLKPINTARVGGFANLANFPAGKAMGNHWGSALTVFYTAAKTPYFFNFHVGDNGHVAIIGPEDSGKNVLLHFLLSEARKYRPRLIMLDDAASSEGFVRTIGGEYLKLGGSDVPVRLSPFSLGDHPRNRKFLTIWLAALMQKSDVSLADADRKALAEAVDHLYTMPAEERSLPAAMRFLESQHAELAHALLPWAEGKFAGIIDHAAPDLFTGKNIVGVDLSALFADTALALPASMLLLHQLTESLDGRPTIIVLKEAWKLLDNSTLGPRIANLLDALRKNNALCIFTTENAEEAAESALSANLMRMVATQIYLPDEYPPDTYETVFGLSEQEIRYLSSMSTAERQFMLKRGQETIIAELNLEGFDSFLPILSGDDSGGDDAPAPATPPESGAIW